MMFRSFYFALSLSFLIANDAVSQCNIVPDVKSPSIPDPCDQDRILRPFPMRTAFVRPSDLMWSKRTWRVLDMREKMNHPLYYPVEQTMCMKSLFDVLKCAILENDLNAFANPIFDDEFTTVMTKEEVRAMLISWDSTHQSEDVNNPGQYIITPMKTEITSEKVRQYWIKEDWFFDKQRSVLEARIVGICPLVEKVSESGEFLGVKPLFWVYFPDARQYLAKAASFNSHNDSERMSYDELFAKRKFASYVYKESNVYNRSIAEYKTGMDALLESELIKEDIFNYESDLWHY
ncbi:MAG: gliding motility protein GldN [Bacteroidota bacterium]|nr:gliding motility protein GldN [Bacteroidota bacterium]